MQINRLPLSHQVQGASLVLIIAYTCTKILIPSYKPGYVIWL